MRVTSLPDRYFERAIPVRVNLDFPIDAPGGEIAVVLVRPFNEKMAKLAATGAEGELEAVARAVRLPAEVVLDMVETDYERVIDALPEALARYVRAGAKTPAPRLIESTVP